MKRNIIRFVKNEKFLCEKVKANFWRPWFQFCFQFSVWVAFGPSPRPGRHQFYFKYFLSFLPALIYNALFDLPPWLFRKTIFSADFFFAFADNFHILQGSRANSKDTFEGKLFLSTALKDKMPVHFHDFKVLQVWGEIWNSCGHHHILFAKRSLNTKCISRKMPIFQKKWKIWNIIVKSLKIKDYLEWEWKGFFLKIIKKPSQLYT